jgi:hypothetical protein
MPLPASYPGTELQRPESKVPDIVAQHSDFKDTSKTPGTPRHPAYPSGHSTYSAAASEILAYFFPQHRNQLERLADNIGVARLWAGVHWRSDHTFGQRLGRFVARLIIQQLELTPVPRFPLARPGNESPTVVKRDILANKKKFEDDCGERSDTAVPSDCVPPLPYEP